MSHKGRKLTVSRSVPGSKHDKKLHDKSHLTYARNTKPISDLGYFGAEGITMPNKIKAAITILAMLLFIISFHLF